MDERRLAVGGVSLLILAILVALVAGAGPNAPSAAQTARTIDSCTTISESGEYELARNITDSTAGACLRVEASDVVLDGGGHAVDGANESGTPGILVGGEASTSNVTVTNVVVTGWGTAIQYQNVTDGRIAAVTASANDVAGIKLRASSDVDIRNATVAGNGVGSDNAYQGNGILIRNGSGNTIREVRAENNTLDGIRLLDSSGNAVRDVVSTGNHRHGLLIKRYSHDNTVRDSHFDVNDRDGLTLRHHSNHNEFVNNTAIDNGHESEDGDGIEVLKSDDNLVKGNVANDNPDDGIGVNNDSQRNRIVDNVATGNGQAGVLVRINSTGNRVVGNRLTGNRYGIFVENPSVGTTEGGGWLGVVLRLEAVRFSVGNGGDLLDTGQNRLVHNTVCNNSDRPIRVVNSSASTVRADNRATC